MSVKHILKSIFHVPCLIRNKNLGLDTAFAHTRDNTAADLFSIPFFKILKCTSRMDWETELRTPVFLVYS